MAKFENGILGAFTGKLGTVVGSSWRGLNIMRAKAKRRKQTSTPEQVDQQMRFALGMKLGSAMSEVFDTGYRYEAATQTGTNIAVSNLVKNAITGLSPNYTIDYSKVLISQGSQRNVAAPSVTTAAGGIVFNWTNNGGRKKAGNDDLVLMAAYCEEEDDVEFILGPATRSSLTARLELPIFVGKQVQTWIAVLSKERQAASDSFFTGAVIVQ